MSKTRADSYAGAICTLFAVYFVYESIRLPFWSSVGPGAGTLPLLAGLAFGALSVSLLVRSVRDRTGASEDAGFAQWRIPASVLGALLVVVIVTKTLGMLITIFLFMAFHSMVVERIRWKVAVPAALATSAVFYLIFEKSLGVPLVIGVLGI